MKRRNKERKVENKTCYIFCDLAGTSNADSAQGEQRLRNQEAGGRELRRRPELPHD